MKRVSITGIRMIISIQLFTTALVLFTGIFAIEIGSIHLNRVLGSDVFDTFTEPLKRALHLGPAASSQYQVPASVSLYQVSTALFKMRVVVLCGGILAALAGLIMVDTIRKPIRALTKGAQCVAAGNYRALVQLPGQDEFGPLVKAFNHMVTSVNESQEQLRKVFFAAEDAILPMDTEEKLTLWGGGCQKLFGYTGEEVIGHPFSRLLAQGVSPDVIPEMQRAAGEEGRWEGELKFRSKDGRVFDGWCVATNLKDEDERLTGYLIVLRDVTDRKQLELQLIQSEKMASVGELAAGVAHEINNPLSGILSNAEFLQEEISEGEHERHEEINEIIRNSERIRVIVRDLLSFSRQKDSDELTPLQINDVIQASLNLTGHQMELDNIRIVTNIQKDLPSLYGSTNKIEQVFINILSNARYALNKKYPEPHEDKVLEIKTSVAAHDGRDYLRTEFIDHGIGIPADLLDRVIHPFFTTKEQGKGTGLGMSISYSIIRDHGGNLVCESEEGEYTRVVVDLPVMEAEEGDGGYIG
jgi:PAS domain S-box-containing protein